MKGFLEQTAAYLHRVYGEELHRFCIVFPNIRAGLFFRKYLAQLSTVCTPTFRSLNILMEEITGLSQADDLSLIFNLFKAYRQHTRTDESFEEFYFWGEMLLNDFDDLDKHLVDAQDLFRNVSDLKEIDLLFDYLSDDQKNAIRVFWQDFNGGNNGLFKAGFASVWTLLYPIYVEFKQQLKIKSLAYEGMIQREAVELLREGNATHTPCEKYVFIGFNALTPCESFFFQSLQKQKRAIFFWDYDDYYLTNQWHEAGAFMRENLLRFPSECDFDSHNLTSCNLRSDTIDLRSAICDLRTDTPENWKLEIESYRLKTENSNKHIEIISVPSETGQTRLAGQGKRQMPSQYARFLLATHNLSRPIRR